MVKPWCERKNIRQKQHTIWMSKHNGILKERKPVLMSGEGGEKGEETKSLGKSLQGGRDSSEGSSLHHQPKS